MLKKSNLLYISLSVFTIYLIYVVVLFGILPSISDSYYYLNNKLLFSLALIGFAFPIIINQNNMLFYIAGSCIMFVAVAPDFHISSEGNVHFFCAVTGVISSMVGLVLMKYYIPVILFIFVALILYFLPNHVFWIEIAAFYTIILTLIFNKNSYE